jgi:hypothetical protein
MAIRGLRANAAQIVKSEPINELARIPASDDESIRTENSKGAAPALRRA